MDKIKEQFLKIKAFFRKDVKLPLVIVKHTEIIEEMLVFVLALFILTSFAIYSWYFSNMKNQETQVFPIVEAPEEDQLSEPMEIDSSSWSAYRSQWYGFELKYPENWEKPVFQKSAAGSSWEYKYLFRKINGGGDDFYSEFDVVIYDVRKIKELFATNEFPSVKNEELKMQGACDEITGHLAENENYPAEEIYIPADDDCYNQAFFYSLTRDQYIYNIVPALKENQEVPADSKKHAMKNFPEFFSAVSNFNLIDIKRPSPESIKPKITAPKPVSHTKDSLGRRVCAAKSDHPQKSKQDKGKHLDMECCLDPDEYPNPWCYYSPNKYDKYL
jgi:hypothetical protein